MKYYFIACINGCRAAVGYYLDEEFAKAEALSHNAIHGHDAACEMVHRRWTPSENEREIKESSIAEELFQRAREIDSEYILQMRLTK